MVVKKYLRLSNRWPLYSLSHAAPMSWLMPNERRSGERVRSVRSMSGNQSTNLDLLRAVAVIAVFVGHYARTRGSNWIGPVNVSTLALAGVLVFFLHTSLVLMMSM